MEFGVEFGRGTFPSFTLRGVKRMIQQGVGRRTVVTDLPPLPRTLRLVGHATTEVCGDGDGRERHLGSDSQAQVATGGALTLTLTLTQIATGGA